VRPDFIAIGTIRGIVCFNLNDPAVSAQEKVMGRGGLRKSHTFLAALVHLRMCVVHRAHGRGCWLGVIGLLSVRAANARDQADDGMWLIVKL
jgi:hypothetical protein